MDAILLAAGVGRRMAPLTPGLAKPLLPIAGRSLLWRMLDELATAGITHCAIVTHHNAADVEAAAKAWPGTMRRTFVAQGAPKGTGHAVAQGAAATKGDVLVVMGDALAPAGVVQALAKADGFVLASCKVADATRYGALVVQGDRVTDLAEKSPRPPSDLVNTGLYRVPRAALDEAARLAPSPRGELEFTDVVRSWAAQGRVRHITADGWMDVGAPWDLLEAQERLLPPTLDALLPEGTVGGPGTIEPGVHVRGRLWVDAGAVVKSGTYIEGDVLVGARSRVGPNAYLRGPIVIGAGCHVGAAVEIKASLLLDGANAPHLNYVGDSVLGPDVNLGAGTKVANLKLMPGNVRATGPDGKIDTGRRKFGVCLGRGVKTGINASLMPGTLIEADTLVPAGQVQSGWITRQSVRS